MANKYVTFFWLSLSIAFYAQQEISAQGLGSDVNIQELQEDSGIRINSAFTLGFASSGFVNDTLNDATTDRLIRPVFRINWERPLELWEHREAFFTAGIQYSVGGNRWEGGSKRNAFHSLGVPLTFRMRTFGFLDLEAGVQPSLLITSGLYDANRSDHHFDYQSHLNPRLYDLKATAGASMPLQGNLSLGFRYERGFFSVNTTPGEEKLFRNAWQFALTFTIPHDEVSSLFVNVRDTMARHHIKQMRKGVVLVRLQGRESSIERMEAENRPEIAEALRERAESENNEIIEAFTNYFTFSDVFFFYSAHSNDIKEDNFENIFSGTDQDEIDIPYIIGNRPIYIVEFTSIRSLALDGLVVQNRYFSQLEAPFPSYVRSRRPIGSDPIPPHAPDPNQINIQIPLNENQEGNRGQERTKTEMIYLLNKQLFQFYERAQ